MSSAQSMSHADAAWLHMDQPTNLMVITGVLWFESMPDWDAVRELIRERFVEPYPRFRQLVTEGRQPVSGPRWADDPHFDLDLHLHRVALPSPGGEAELRRLVADITSTPLDPSRPLWQFHFVEGYGEGAAMITRIHHCIADGIALARVLLSLTDEVSEGGAPDVEPPPPASQAGSLGSAFSQLQGAVSGVAGAAGAVAREALEVARNPHRLVDLASAGREDAEALNRILLKPADPRTPLKGEMGIAKQVTWSRPIPLDAVKQFSRDTGTTINDVLMAAMTGAFRRYLADRDGLVDQVTAFVPFNLRRPDRPLPSTLGNRFGLVFLDMPVGLEDKDERLKAIHDSMDAIKHSPEAVVSYGTLDAIGRTPRQVEQRVVDLISSKGSAVITNVPGPREPVFLAGTPVAGVLVWAPCSGEISMTVSIFSYDGAITVGFMADAKVIPDPDELVAAFEAEAGELFGIDTA